MDYPALTLIGLFIAIFVNLYEPRALLLCFVAVIFLVFVGQLLPDPNTLSDSLAPYWFLILSSLEFAFICCALATKALQSTAVAMFSGWNIIGNGIGYLAYTHNSALYDTYSAIIRLGELSQIAALILLSRPIIHFAIWYKDRAGKDYGGHQSVATTG